MKKLYFTLIAMTFLLLAGCNDSDESPKTKTVTSDAVVIDEADLEQSEKDLIGTFTNDSLVYDVRFDDEERFKEISFSIDEYHFGKLKDTFLEGSTSIEKEDRKKPMRLLFAREFADGDYTNWTIATISKSGSRSSMKHSIKTIEMGGWTSNYASLPLELKKGKKHPVGVLIESKDGSFSSSSDFDTKEGFAELAKYDRVYLFNVEVK